jgi:hypothetical protein
VKNENVVFLVTEEEDELFRIPFRFDSKKLKEKATIECRPITNSKNVDIGVYYSEIKSYYSEGSEEKLKIMIGKSKKQWLCLTMSKAVLTKDLEYFSKMDPYCKFSINKDESEAK